MIFTTSVKSITVHGISGTISVGTNTSVEYADNLGTVNAGETKTFYPNGPCNIGGHTAHADFESASYTVVFN